MRWAVVVLFGLISSGAAAAAEPHPAAVLTACGPALNAAFVAGERGGALCPHALAMTTARPPRHQQHA